MRKIIVIAIVLSLVMVSMPAFAAKGRRGASDRAYEQASDKAVFNRVGDWFATRGKSEKETKAILAERKTKRAAARAQKEAEKKKKIAEKQMRKQQKLMREKAQKMKKGLKK